MILETIAFARWPDIPCWIGAIIPGGYFMAFAIISILFFRDWRQVKKVAHKAQMSIEVESLLTDKTA
jgi:hypothetical protein